MKALAGSIRAFFKPASKAAGAKRASGGAATGPSATDASQDAAAAAAEPAAAAGDPPPPAVFARKRRRTSGGIAAAAAAGPAPAAPTAAPAGGSGPPAAASPSPAAAAGAAAAAAAAAPAAAAGDGAAAAVGARPKQLTQMYLDVGQRHFHSYRCPTCGMLYARGTDADERLHAAFHASATQGPRFQGWAGERVVQLDGSKGRVLLFGGAGQGRPRKQLGELCGFLEEQMGLPSGWLLQVPLTVLLYVSAARRVQGFVAAESIKEAFCVRPTLPPAAAQGMLSCGSAVQPGSGGGGSGGAGQAAGVAAAGAGRPAAVGGDAPAGRATAAAHAHAVTSGRSLLSVTLSTGAAAAAEYSSGVAAEGPAGGGAPADVAAVAAQASGEEGAAAPGSATGQRAELPQPAQQQAQQPVHMPQQAQPRPALAPLELDRSQRVRAVCGVRLMWVSLEARRRGLASRLLDCCRSHFMPGYVLPRHELAFSAPTDDGRAFIEQYAGSRKFLVYE